MMEGKYHEISKGDLVHSFNRYVQDAPYGPGPSGVGGTGVLKGILRL